MRRFCWPLLLLSGCLSQTRPPTVRYFRPLPFPPAGTDAGAAVGRLRVERVTAAPWLDDRMLLRVSDVEYVFDETGRWVDTPAELVADALAASLTASSGATVDAMTRQSGLAVHVTAFEEAWTPAPQALVELQVIPRGAPGFRVRATSPMDGEGPEALARAMGSALRQAVDRVLEAARGGS